MTISNHNRACPKCGVIVEWTKGDKVTHRIRDGSPNGKKITAYKAHLICPEHGEFEPRVHEKLREKLQDLRI